MFSNDPSTLTRKDKFDKEEASRAIRNDIAAEIDAINFYLQQNKYIEDEKLRKVHEDITSEEMTHFGEFLRLLYEVSPKDFDYFNKGWEEASKLIGDKPLPLSVPQTSKNESKVNDESKVDFQSWIFEGINSSRVVRNVGNLIKWNSTTISYSEITLNENAVSQEKKLSVYELPYISFEVKYYLGQPTENRRVSILAGNKFGMMENLVLLKEHPLSPLKMGNSVKASDWNQTGNILNDVLKAYEVLAKDGFSKEIFILISPSNYAKTFRTIDKAGTLEIGMIKSLGSVISTNVVEDNEIYVISKSGFDILLYSDVTIEPLGKEKDYENYLISEQIAPRLVSKNAACIIKQ